MPQVAFQIPGKMNLLGYILRSLMARNLETSRGAQALRKMRGTVLVDASGMQVTLEFSRERVQIALGEQGRAGARVRGNLGTLLQVALGGSLVWPVVSGRLKVGGRFWRLLPMLKLLKTRGVS